MASIWDGIDNPELDKRSGLRLPYLYPGKFLLRVKKVAHYPSQKNPRDHWFRVDFEIVEGAKQGVDEVAWVVNMSRGKLALSDIRAFVKALMGEEIAITSSSMDEITGSDQPAAGLLVRCDAVNKKTEAGGDFTQTFWSAAEEG
jgi:hypothetical protein